DKIKEEARLAVQKIKELNIRSMMLTGDNAQTARNIANQLFIEDVVAHMKPHEKLEKIKELQNKNFTVAMVGDGVNDAPALSTANVGIALEGGSHVALESSDITLLSGDILKVSDAISLSRKTLKIIKQNLFWAFFYNVAAIPLAAFGYLHPMIAAGAMSLSSLTVVLNALRLKTKNVV
ncbi:MAG: HAD-IC family P-type ATPase, partial [Deltaproteobacteria bacterium]|nr:HAD-IC family P-type ATPase [Deltaproteobacteria bacterium]